jgi:hypothetical protein
MNTQRKPGDWNCNSCQHLNFGRRDFCQRCRATRSDLQFGDGREIGGVLTSLDVRPGDWYCNCGYHNFACRSSCLKCGTIVRDFPAGQGGTGAAESGGVRAGWKTGDWICTRFAIAIVYTSNIVAHLTTNMCICHILCMEWNTCMHMHTLFLIY